MICSLLLFCIVFLINFDHLMLQKSTLPVSFWLFVKTWPLIASICRISCESFGSTIIVHLFDVDKILGYLNMFVTNCNSCGHVPAIVSVLRGGALIT